MSYETVAAMSQTFTLLLFISMFFIVLGYVFWPSNQDRLRKRTTPGAGFG